MQQQTKHRTECVGGVAKINFAAFYIPRVQPQYTAIGSVGLVAVRQLAGGSALGRSLPVNARVFMEIDSLENLLFFH